MPIDFSPARWDRVKQTYDAWWAGTLERPAVSIQLYGRDPGRPMPSAALLSQSTCMDLNVPADQVIDRIDYELSRITYLGDAFPYFNLDCFGPGVLAAFCGVRMDNSSGRVWFFPEKVVPLSELHLEYDANNVWLNRIKEICRAGMRRWQGQVLIGMADLGGILDILSSFRTTENLLMDLYDEPQEVERLIWEVHTLWHRCFDEINEALRPETPGYSDWLGIYSTQPCYVLQSDFAYMIGPDMFDRFVKPELTASCRRLPHSMYHLDGVGQLAHLDSLLQIQELNGVQWVPGDGMPGVTEWPDVQRKISRAGKRLHSWWGDLSALDVLKEQIGSGGRGLFFRAAMHGPEGQAEIRERLKRHAVE